MGTVIKNRGTSCVGVRKTGTTLIHVSTVMGTLYIDGIVWLKEKSGEKLRKLFVMLWKMEQNIHLVVQVVK